MLLIVLIGFAFGYVGSIPVAGPITMLVLHLSLAHDPRHALYVAVGGAVAESFYALLAFWGLSTVLVSYPMVFPVARTVGAAILLALGLFMLLRRTAETPPKAPEERKGTKRSLALGFLVTAINPALIVTWTAAVAALHATGLIAMDRAKALPFAGSVCLGIILWFLTLLRLASKWRNQASVETLGRYMRGMGAVLAALGGYMTLRGLLQAFLH
jgi:threonine/homoserine/homoserine lactone efflux protein